MFFLQTAHLFRRVLLCIALLCSFSTNDPWLKFDCFLFFPHDLCTHAAYETAHETATTQRARDNPTASVLFFGSARAKDREGWEKAVAKAEEELAAATDDESRKVRCSLRRRK